MRAFFISLGFIALITLTVTLANSLSAPDPLPANKGGIILTFDDRNFKDWLAAIPLFDQYGVNAIFFISGPIDQAALKTADQLP